MDAERTERFWSVLRAVLPFSEDGSDLSESDRLSDWGLDSMATIALVAELEDQLEVYFPDELLVPDTFLTAGLLLSAVTTLS